MTEVPCAACHGRRLNQRAQAVKVAGKTIWEVTGFSVDDAKDYFDKLDLSHADNGNAARDHAVADKILREIQQRLNFLIRSRPALSDPRPARRYALRRRGPAHPAGGTVGLQPARRLLHPRRTDHRPASARQCHAAATLRRLEQLGNSVLVVEHDEATIQSADLIIDLGPGAGVHGGNVVSIGTPEEIRNNPDSPTGAYLRSERKRLGPKRELTKTQLAHHPRRQGA